MKKLRFPGDYIYISSPYGMRTLNGVSKKHNGIDLGWSSKYGGQNTPILAAADGVVIAAVDGKNNDTRTSTYGNYVILDHGDGITTLYGHLLKGSVPKKGSSYKQGEQFAKKNNSGYSFGSHLHFEVRINGVQVDPLLYTFADTNMIISSDTTKKYNILKHDFSKVEPIPEPIPEPKIELFKKGEIVIPTRLVNYTGTKLIQYDKQYEVVEDSKNDRVVLGARRKGKLIVWAAMNIKDVRRV